MTYTITVANTGPSDAQTVLLSDIIPANTTFVSDSQTSGPAFTITNPLVGGTGTINGTIATLASGASANFTVVVRSLSSTPNGGTISNTASVSTVSTDNNLLNNTATASTSISTQSDIVVTKVGPIGPIFAGNTLTYTIIVANTGFSDAQTILLTDIIPANTTFVSDSQTSGPAFTITNPVVGGTGTISGTIATLASGASANFTVVVRSLSSTPNGGTISNTASVSTVSTDNNLLNNTATASTSISTQSDIVVTKVGPIGPIFAGNTLTYTIIVANTGFSDAQTILLTDIIPANTTFVSDSQTSGPAFTITNPAVGGTGTINGTIATLASGASANFTVVVRVATTTPDGTTIRNEADISTTTRDANIANNASAVTTKDMTPPAIVLLQRFGYHYQPTILVLTFSTPLDPSRAENVNNYQIVALGFRGAAGSFRGVSAQVTEAVYDSASKTVTLHLSQRLNIHNLYQITVIGTAPNGIAGPAGTLLDGSGNGAPGSNFVGTISRQNLVVPSTVQVHRHRASVASSTHSIRASLANRPNHAINANAVDHLSVSGQLNTRKASTATPAQRRHAGF